jgi:peptidoglycan/xylan/chitin deacetylase (PgdA/CDA1 family)
MKHDWARMGPPLASAIGLFAGTLPIQRLIMLCGLHILNILGVFKVARYLTRSGLRIICYHGFAIAEEYKYRGTLFIRDELFRRRMKYLQRKGFPILPLREAIEALGADQLPACATVITMDDGWRGVYSVGLPIIKELQIPVTVYVTTYYIEHPMPVYSVTLSYLFWRSKKRWVDLPRGLGTFDLDSPSAGAEEAAHEFGMLLPPAERFLFLRELGDALGVPFEEIERQHLFYVMNEQELRCLSNAGVDIQLHSHRHQWSLEDREKVEAEIVENREFLQRIVSHPLEHFCYPSGVYALHQGKWLAALGVKSATTIDPGLNYADTSRFALRRTVDGTRVTDIEFAAEMTGFMEIIRWLRDGRLLPMLRRQFRFAQRPKAGAAR